MSERDTAAGADVTRAIREMRKGGASRAEIRRQLQAQGFDESEARTAIELALGNQRAAMQRPSRARSGGGGSGILGMIAFVLLLNLLSYVFDWGWFFY